MLDTRITAAVVLLAVTSLNATVTELYRRCSKANLDKSEVAYYRSRPSHPAVTPLASSICRSSPDYCWWIAFYTS